MQIAEQWVGHRKIYIITPASLISNMYKEFRSLCTHNHYVSKSERDILKEFDPVSSEYLNLIKDINKRIDSNVNIISYNKFNIILTLDFISGLNDSYFLYECISLGHKFR